MKITQSFVFFLAVMMQTGCFAENLVLSHKLELHYPKPETISHSRNALLIIYKDWNFMHEIVNPKEIYQQIDLTGIERDFIRSIFDVKAREKFPAWLAALAKEQAQVFGVTPTNVKRRNVGSAEIINVYNTEDKKCFIFVFDELAIHQIHVSGGQDHCKLIIQKINER